MGYDILGYIISIVSGMRTDAFIRKHIFKPLGMRDSCFHIDLDDNESTPYQFDGKQRKQGIKEQQNWYSGNAYISCTLRDYNKFMTGYQTLLDRKYINEYKSLYYFINKTINNRSYKIFCHWGGGDFTRDHANGIGNYIPLSVTYMGRYTRGRNNINVILTQNYTEKTGLICDTNMKLCKYMDEILGILL